MTRQNKTSSRGRWIAIAVVVAAIAGVGAAVAVRLADEPGGGDPARGPSASAIPVEVAAVERTSIEHRRMFSGTLEATARTTIAPKVAGRIVALPVDLADEIRRGQVVARLDSEEFAQAVAQAEAELAVAQAGLAEAESAAAIAEREFDRIQTLHGRGIASDSQRDTVEAERLSRTAAVQVARAQVTRAEAAAQSARIRLGYTTIVADWEAGDARRVVAERFVEEGDTVAANTPLVSIIDLDPIEAVIFVTERDYAELAPGKAVTLATDAYPGRTWPGEVARVSPVFRAGSRQARVEIAVTNTDGALKPGMFVRVAAVLDRAESTLVVPSRAVSRRQGRAVLFTVESAEGDQMVARMIEVDTGISQGDRVQLLGDPWPGREPTEILIVSLGMQMLSDGTSVVIPEGSAPVPARAAGDPAGTAGETAAPGSAS